MSDENNTSIGIGFMMFIMFLLTLVIGLFVLTLGGQVEQEKDPLITKHIENPDKNTMVYFEDTGKYRVEFQKDQKIVENFTIKISESISYKVKYIINENRIDEKYDFLRVKELQ
jgi:hypothetical protein